LQGNVEAALADCNQALRAEPNVAETFDSRALVYLKMGQWDAAIADYNAALRLKPALASALYGRGYVRLKKGDAKGNDDMARARATRATVADEFVHYGVK
jgi:tetratricopeptide (TPR) repeat protein